MQVKLCCDSQSCSCLALTCFIVRHFSVSMKFRVLFQLLSNLQPSVMKHFCSFCISADFHTSLAKTVFFSLGKWKKNPSCVLVSKLQMCGPVGALCTSGRLERCAHLGLGSFSDSSCSSHQWKTPSCFFPFPSELEMSRLHRVGGKRTSV